MLWQDKVCIYSEKNCMPAFQFQTQKDGIAMSQEIGGLIGIAPGGPANILDQLYKDGTIGVKQYAFYNPIGGGQYDMAAIVGEFNPKIINPESTQVMKVVGTEEWKFQVNSFTVNGRNILPRGVRFANLSFGGGYSAFPKEMYISFCRAVYGAAPIFMKSSRGICFEDIQGACPTNLPTFTVNAGSATFDLGPDYYTDEYQRNGETRCALLLRDQIITFTPDEFTLSSALLRKRVLVLNQEKMTMELSEEGTVKPKPIPPPTPIPSTPHGLSFGSWVIIFIVIALTIGAFIAVFVYLKKRREQKKRYAEQADLARERAETEASARDTLMERPEGVIN